MSQFFSPISSRRQWLRSTACGFGSLALASLLADERARGDAVPNAPWAAFHPEGQADDLRLLAGLTLPDRHVRLQAPAPEGRRQAGRRGHRQPLKYLGSPWKFSQHGQSGHWISELYPHVAKHADKLCMLKSLTTDIPNHPQAVLQLHTGAFRFARPSFGSWLLYGLGTENKELPGFLVLSPLIRVGGAQNYGNAFLPSRFQATRIGQEGQPIAKAALGYVQNTRLDASAQRQQLDLISDLNRGRPQPQTS